MKDPKNKFTENTTLAELLNYPRARDILLKYNLPCLSCPFAKIEMEDLKIENICKMYRIDLGKLLKELNEK